MRNRTSVLKIAGAGDQALQLRALARDLGISDQVGFEGVVENMPAFWSACDVAVVPTRRPLLESFGLTACEAMACGVPVVVTANGALSEVVSDGATGVVVPEGSPSVLSRVLDDYVADRALREAHGRAGRARCLEQFDIAASASEYAQLFGAALDHATPAHRDSGKLRRSQRRELTTFDETLRSDP